MSARTRVLARPVAAVAGAVGMVGLLIGAPTSAAWPDTTATTASMAAQVVAPPPSVAVSVPLIQLLSCSVTVSWTSSPTPGVDGYDVVLLRNGSPVASTSTGPGATSHTFTGQSILSGYQGRVTATAAGFESVAVTSTPGTCLI